MNMSMWSPAACAPCISLTEKLALRSIVGNREAARNNGNGSKKEFRSDSKSVLEIKKVLLSHCRDVIVNHPKRFVDFFTSQAEQRTEARGGFALAAWCGDEACESWAKEALNVTIRCLPFDQSHENAGSRCVVCGKPRSIVALFAKNY